MMVMILQNAPASLRGELTRWLIEPKPGVFVGHVSALVRDRLWEKCTKQKGLAEGVVQLWTTNNEQHFDIRSWGDNTYQPVNYEGIWLISRQPQANTPAAKPEQPLETALKQIETLSKTTSRPGRKKNIPPASNQQPKI